MKNRLPAIIIVSMALLLITSALVQSAEPPTLKIAPELKTAPELKIEEPGDFLAGTFPRIQDEFPPVEKAGGQWVQQCTEDGCKLVWVPDGTATNATGTVMTGRVLNTLEKS